MCGQRHTSKKGGVVLNIQEAAEIINSTGRRESDPPIILICSCSSCGIEYARLPQDVALSARNDTPVLCNRCAELHKKSRRSSRLYHRRNGLGWKHSLGIAFPKEGNVKSDGPYTEIMQRFELWLRDSKGLQPNDYLKVQEQHKELRKEFFMIFIEEPGLFSTQPIKKCNHKGETVYICSGCQSQLNHNYFLQCCPSKKAQS